MKKTRFYLLAGFACTLLLTSVLHAQNSSPYWSLAGNSNASTSSKLGTINAIPLRLFTKNTTRLSIDTLGHVAINTTTSSSTEVQINSASSVRPLRLLVNGSTRLLAHYNGGLTVGNGTAPPSQGLYVAGNVGIGTATPQSGYKMDVEAGSSNGLYVNSSSTYGISSYSGYAGVYGYASGGTGFGYGVFGQSTYTGVTGSGGSYGVSGYCSSTSGGYGVYGSATTNASGIGVYGTGYYGVKAISPTLYGVDGTGYYVGVVGHGSTSNSFSYGTEGYGVYQGGYFTGGTYGVQGYASSNGYGVYGSANSGYAGYFNGTVFATTYTGSDRKLKKDIEDVSNAVDIIKKLQPKTYEYRQDGNYQYMHLPEGKHYGLIAQDLEQVLPTLVKDTKFDTRIEQQAQAKAQAGGAPNTTNATQPQSSEVIDFKAVNYTELIPILVKAVQEQQQKIERLENVVNVLLQQKDVNALTNSVLLQNVPNPTDQSTRISYTLPAGTTQAQLLLTDAAGKTLRAMSLNNSGVIELNTASLSSGVYNYSLLVDGKVIETKRLVVAR